jgi:RNA polymerase sigma-70 factor (ECF subfamily)
MLSGAVIEDLQPWIRERLSSAQAGDYSAFGDVIERLNLIIRHCVIQFGAPLDEADELAQRTCVEAFGKLPDFDLERPFIPWVRGIARHVVLRFYERRRLDARHRDDRIRHFLALATNQEAGQEWTDERYDLNHLQDCLQKLSPSANQLIRDRYFADLDAPTIATRDGGAVEAVRMALSRARAALRQCIERRLDSGGTLNA